MSEKSIDIAGQMQKISETISEYKDKVVATFKDIDVEVQNWDFAIGKAEQEYTVEVNVKLRLKPKKVS